MFGRIILSLVKIDQLKKHIIKILKIVIPLGIGVYLTWFFYSGLTQEEKDAIPVAFTNANYFWVLLSLVAAWLGHMSRAYRWKFLMEPLGYKPKLSNMYHATMIGYVLNFTIPRSGEIARPGFLAKKEKLPFDKVFGTVVAERIIDVVMLLSILGITGLIVGKQVINDITTKFEVEVVIDDKFNSSFLKPITLGDSTNGFILLTDVSSKLKKDYIITKIDGMPVGGIDFFEHNLDAKKVAVSGLLPEGSYMWLLYLLIGGFMIGAILISIKKIRKLLIEKMKGMWEGVKTIFTMKKRIPFIFHTLFIWFTYVMLMWLMAQAVDGMESIGIKELLVGFMVGAIAIGITPGGIGLYPMFIAGALVYFGYDNGLASSFAIMAWVIQTILLVALGIYSLYAIKIKFSNSEVEEQV